VPKKLSKKAHEIAALAAQFAIVDVHCGIAHSFDPLRCTAEGPSEAPCGAEFFWHGATVSLPVDTVYFFGIVATVRVTCIGCLAAT
jgi:hypothetical protein